MVFLFVLAGQQFHTKFNDIFNDETLTKAPLNETLLLGKIKASTQNFVTGKEILACWP